MNSSAEGNNYRSFIGLTSLNAALYAFPFGHLHCIRYLCSADNFEVFKISRGIWRTIMS